MNIACIRYRTENTTLRYPGLNIKVSVIAENTFNLNIVVYIS